MGGEPGICGEILDAGVSSVAGPQVCRDDVVVVLRYEQPQCELALNPAYCVTEAHGEHRMAKNVSAAMENNQWSENA